VRVLGRVRQRLRDDVVGRHLDWFGQAVLCSHVTITPSQDGPYIVSGPARLVAPDGHEIEHPDPMSICRCGGSSNKSFCDGTHATIDCDGTLAH
jgi:CDGSH-type Zn-finger protein